MMLRPRPPLRLGLLALVLLLAAPAAGADLVEGEWHSIRSPNFSGISRVSERKSSELLQDLERFRLVTLTLLDAQAAALPVPTRVVILQHDHEWRGLGLPDEALGAFIGTPRENLIVTLGTPGGFELEVIQHEYVHLLQSRSRAQVPLWYQEGFAEFLSTVRPRGEFVDIGRVPNRLLRTLGALSWRPIRHVIAPEDTGSWSGLDRAMFYAESWLLVHFLIAGGDYPDSFSRRLGEYLRAVEAGKPGEGAFEDAFAVKLSTLDRKLRQYGERGRYDGFALPASRFEPPKEIAIGPAAPTDVALLLGRLELVLDRPVEAQAYFSRAVAVDRERAAAHAGLARTQLRADQRSEARASIERARLLAPDDLDVVLDHAGFLLEAAESSDDPGARTADVQEARRLLVAAWKRDKTRPETYWLYGRSYLMLGDSPGRAVEMLEESLRILPDATGIRLDLADAYLAAGRPADAAAAARTVIAWSHQETPNTARARAILARIPASAGPEGGADAAGPGAAPAR